VTRVHPFLLPALLGVLLAAPTTAAANDPPPCPSDQPPATLSVTDPKGAGSLYATHILRANVQGGEARSFSAPGARIFSEDNGNRPTLVRDSAGPLTVAAAVVIRDTETLPYQDDYSCSTTASATVDLLAPAASLFGDFRRPRYIVPARKLYSPSPDFSFTVKLAKVGADQSPFTVRARRASRMKVPGRGTKAASHDYPLRDFELGDGEESRACELLCSSVTDRGFQRRIEVGVERVSRGIKVRVTTPTGLHFWARGEERFKPTPWGVDVEVVQSGHRIARLRAAARCDSYGQSSTCRFKTVSTKL
jgi:hypothetical protein